MWERMRTPILEKVKPPLEIHEKVCKVADHFVDTLNRMSPDDIEVVLTGSFAKETYIKDDVDFDVFLLFPHTYSLEQLQSLTFAWGKKLLDRWEVAYAQHPYLRGEHKGHRVDIVPSYKLDEGSGQVSIRSAVDRTQLHTKYILANITPEQKDDVRVLKVFLKRLGIYGAEIRTGGFSGYLCELLIIKYGSFYGLIHAARGWKFPIAVDMEGGRSERLLRTLFKNQPFIVTDPVDRKRNVAAPVSVDSLSKFVAAAHVFFINPSSEVFFEKLKAWKKEEVLAQVKARGTSFVLYRFNAPEKSADILWGELRKTIAGMEKPFDSEGFDCTHMTAEVHKGKCYLLFELVHGTLPRAKMYIGPYVRMGPHLERFMREEKNNMDIFVKDERMCAIRPRKFVTSKELAEEIVKNPEKYGVSKGLANELASAEIFLNSNAVFEESLLVFTKHFNRKFYLGL